MTASMSASIWERAEKLDPSVRVEGRQQAALARKRVTAQPYSRQRLFEAMAASRVALFCDLDVPLTLRGERVPRDEIAAVLAAGFAAGARARVQMGPSRTRGTLPIREVLSRWERGRARLGVTDLHIRGSHLERVMDTSSLSGFNLMVDAGERIQRQEMMSLVISSAGNVTDSHSDDPDGSNHCFAGQKLWLMWDAFEGLSQGLEDVERVDVYGLARFDMSTFLRLKSSAWLLIGAGETLFLPGRMTHKVLTLEPYLGVGSFHLALPSCAETLARWLYRGPLWNQSGTASETTGLVEEMLDRTIETASQALADGSAETRRRWGSDFLGQGFETWRRMSSQAEQACALADPRFAALAELAEKGDRHGPRRPSAAKRHGRSALVEA